MTTETKTTHTPGPMRTSGIRIVCDRTATIVAETSQPQPFGDEERIANGRLLAAAYTSYDRAFGPAAVEAAENDLLGECLQLLAEADRTITRLSAECAVHGGFATNEQEVQPMIRDILAKLPAKEPTR